MLIENFITCFARKKNSGYLQFSPNASSSIPRSKNDAPFLLYIHIPFCEELCPYCSFNRVAFNENLAKDYFGALRKEITSYKKLGYKFGSLYVGGGTPTILIDQLRRTLELAKRSFDVSEISVETNPNHLTKKNIEILKSVGVNRLSVGVQSFDDDLLKAMERYHKYGSGQIIAERLKFTQGNFDTLNVDMIFNFPKQTMAVLEKDLSVLIELGVDQITYYPLMVSTSTQNAINKKLGSIDYKREKKFYKRIARMLSPHYQASTAWCFSKSASMIDEYVVNFEEYAGLGSGSFGYLGGSVYANTFDIKEYINRLNKGSLPIAAKKDFSTKERLRYDFLMKLFGLSLNLDHLRSKTGHSVYRYLWPEIFFFRLTGGIKKSGDILSLTQRGQYYWVIMMREFFIGVNNFRDFFRANLKPKNIDICEKTNIINS